MRQSLSTQRLLALFGGGGLLLNFPLLGLWDREFVVFGVPVLWVALFALWGTMIALLAGLMERADDSSQDD